MKKSPVKLTLVILALVTAVYLVGSGMTMHARVTRLQESYNQLQYAYYSQPQSVRDAAVANSALAEQRAMIEQYPSVLQQLEVGGNGKILAGIFVLLLGIFLGLFLLPCGCMGLSGRCVCAGGSCEMEEKNVAPEKPKTKKRTSAKSKPKAATTRKTARKKTTTGRSRKK